MKKINAKQIIIPAIILFAICLCVSLFLSLTNVFTKKPIENQEIQKQNDSRKIVLPMAINFKENTLCDGCYVGFDDKDNIVGYTFITKSNGYGGDISVMTGIKTDGKINGVVVLSQNETPGLGANIQKDDFISQYENKQTNDDLHVVKNSTTNDNEIQAITGATISSKATTSAVNKAIAEYRTIVDKGDVSHE